MPLPKSCLIWQVCELEGKLRALSFGAKAAAELQQQLVAAQEAMLLRCT